MKRFLLGPVIFPLMLAVGCASPSVGVSRLAETHGHKGERIVILVSGYTSEGVQLSDLGSVEKSIEQCVQRHAKKHTLFTAAEFRELVAAGVTPGETYESPQQFEQSLQVLIRNWHRSLRKEFTVVRTNKTAKDTLVSPEQYEQSLQEMTREVDLGKANVRFVVVVEGSYYTSPAGLDANSVSGGGVIGIGWDQNAELSATVLDLKYTRIAGAITSHATGAAGGGVGFVYVIPVPFFFNSATESKTCKTLGKELVRFISE